MLTKKCRYCGAIFQTNKKQKKYCCKRCKDKYSLENKRIDDTDGKSICWNCIHAVPNYKKGRGCSWSMDREPVAGCQYKQTTVNCTGKVRNLLKMISCPKFEQGE